MIFDETKYKFMYAALQEAEKALEDKEVPVGAVIVKDNKIIGRGYNQIERLKDSTAHAEMIALTAASNYLKEWRLTGCSIFVTLEPCIMCTGALLASRISNLYYATSDPKYGACGSIYNLAEEARINHKIKVYSGLMEAESKTLIRKFFQDSRLRKEK